MKVSKRDRAMNFLDPIVDVIALLYIAVVVIAIAVGVGFGVVALVVWLLSKAAS